MRISPVSWPETVALRQAVLGWTAEPTSGDQEPETTHIAALDPEGRVVGVVSMVELPCPEEPDEPGLYFWAMAVDSRFQRRGIGRSLIAELLRRARAARAAVMWADARTAAIPSTSAAEARPSDRPTPMTSPDSWTDGSYFGSIGDYGKQERDGSLAGHMSRSGHSLLFAWFSE